MNATVSFSWPFTVSLCKLFFGASVSHYNNILRLRKYSGVNHHINHSPFIDLIRAENVIGDQRLVLDVGCGGGI